MGMNRNRAIGLAGILLVLVVFSMLAASYEFPMLNSAETVEMKTTEFLWTYRLIDLIAQAFVLFAAAACCVAVLRAEERE